MELHLAKQPFYETLSRADSAIAPQRWDEAWARIDRLLESYSVAELAAFDDHVRFFVWVSQACRYLGVEHLGTDRSPSSEEIAGRLEPFYEQLRGDEDETRSGYAACRDLLWASIELQRGRPDLAQPFNATAREILAPRDGRTLAYEYSSLFFLAHFQRAELENAWDEPQEAIRVLLALLAEMARLEASPAWAGATFGSGEHCRIQAYLGGLFGALARKDAAYDERALESFSAALAIANGHPEDHHSALTQRAWLSIGRGALEAAERDLTAAAALTGIERENVIWREALAARVDRSRKPAGGSGARLEALQQLLEQLASGWEDRAARGEGGTGFLYYDRVRFALGESLALRLGSNPGRARIGQVLEWLAGLQLPGLLARELATPAVTLDDITSELTGEGGGLVTFVVAKDRTHVIAFDSEFARHRELDFGEYELEQSVSAFHAELFGGDPARAAKLAEQLFGSLFPDELGCLVASWRRVCIVDRDMVGGLAFEGLRDTEGWWGLAKQVSEVPSFPVGVQLARRARSVAFDRQGWVELYADVEVEGLEPLPSRATPFTESSGRSTWLHGQRSSVTELEASLSELRPFALLAVAHGVRDRHAAQRTTQLALARGERLGADALAQLSMPPITLLSVCSGRAGFAPIGDSASGHLGGAALRGGALAVVLSEQKVFLHSNAVFANAFRESLEKGATAGEAFHRAVVALERAGFGPGDWARYAFLGCATLRGSAQQPTGGERLGLRLGLSLAAMLLALLYLRRRLAQSGSMHRQASNGPG